MHDSIQKHACYASVEFAQRFQYSAWSVLVTRPKNYIIVRLWIYVLLVTVVNTQSSCRARSRIRSLVQRLNWVVENREKYPSMDGICLLQRRKCRISEKRNRYKNKQASFGLFQSDGSSGTRFLRGEIIFVLFYWRHQNHFEFLSEASPALVWFGH